MAPCRMCIVIVAAAGSLTVAVAAQQHSPDRPLQPDMLGNPAVDLVLPAHIANDGPAWRIASLGRVPLGFEGPVDQQGPHESQRFDLTGSTVRQALDLIVQHDPTYRWKTIDDIVVVRPVSAWADRNDILNRSISGIAWDGVTAEEALFKASALLSGPTHANLRPMDAHDNRRLDIRVDAGSTLDVLNAIVRADGGTMWSVVYGAEQPGQPVLGRVTVALKWFDGHKTSLTLR